MCTMEKHVLENPYQITACQHLFCRHCIAQEIQKAESLSCPKCKIRFKKDDIIFSAKDNERLQSIWNAVYGVGEGNPYVSNSGYDKETIFFSRDFYDYKTVVPIDTQFIMDSFSATGKHFKGSINVRDGIELQLCKIDGYTNSLMGKLKAADCVFKDSINARDGIVLMHSTGSEVRTDKGSAIIKDGSYSSIEAQGEVSLTNVNVGKVKSMGKVGATYGIMGSIEAYGEATLHEVTCQSVSVSMGEIYTCHSTIEGLLKASHRVKVEDSSAHSVEVSRGKAIINNSKAMSVEARDGVDLIGTIISGNITSSMGSVEAFACNLRNIEAYESIKLLTSSAKSVTLNASKEINGMFKAYLELEEGEIDGDVHVVVNKTFNDFIEMSKTFGKVEIDNLETMLSENEKENNNHKCVLEILGKGTIKGKVEFINCQGETVYL